MRGNRSAIAAALAGRESEAILPRRALGRPWSAFEFLRQVYKHAATTAVDLSPHDFCSCALQNLVQRVGTVFNNHQISQRTYSGIKMSNSTMSLKVVLFFH
jgi:hypothetical protein